MSVSSSPALLVIDMQKHFLYQNPPAFRTGLIPNIERALAAARKKQLLLVHIHTQYSADKSDWPRAWSHREQIWCMHGTSGAEVIESLAPLPGEPVIIKKRFSAFHDTQLDSLLRAHGIDGLVLCGYSSDVCIRFTAVDAYNRNYSVTLLSDCTAPEKEDPEDSLSYLKRLINARIIPLEDFENGPTA